MTIPSSPSWVAVAILESGLLAGLLFVCLLLIRVKVNGPCRLCLALLFAWRVSIVSTAQCAVPRWDYLWGVLFGYSFLYATYHLAGLARRIQARDPQHQQIH